MSRKSGNSIKTPMPELPEVHTVVTDLNKNISGYRITGIEIEKSYKIIPHKPFFKKSLLGKTIIEVKRIAKNILIKISPNNFLLIHLGMTGRILLRNIKDTPDRWTHVTLKIRKRKQVKELRFTDTRKFGKIGVIGEKDIPKLLTKYGPEPIDPKLSNGKFHEIILSKKTNIKSALLDQKLISGMGNIYATDALFLAGINPQIRTSKITLDMAKRLLRSARSVLEEGMRNRGSTMPDKAYVDIFGKAGSQQKSFKIYMKEKCPNCNAVVCFIKLNGRGTYFCENCQPNENKNP